MKYLFSLLLVAVLACASYAHGPKPYCGGGYHDGYYNPPQYHGYYNPPQHYYSPHSPYYRPRPYYGQPAPRGGGFYYDNHGGWGYWGGYGR